MSTLAHSPTNDHRLDDLMKEVRAFGRDAAAGGDSLPKLAHKVVRAAADKVIDTNKDSSGKDAAHHIYTAYAEEHSRKAIHEHTDGGAKSNVSKVRKLIEFGSMTIINPVETMNRTHVMREELRKAGEKMRPAYASYVEVAREQLKQAGADLSDDQIKSCILKPATPDKSVQKELEGIHKRLEKLITGEGGLKDQDPLTIQAEEAIRSRLACIMAASQTAFYGEFTSGADDAQAEAA